MLFRPVVGIVGDAAGLVGFDLITLHDPFDGGTPVDHIIIGFERDVGERNPGVVLDDRFVQLVREAHLLHAEFAAFRACHLHFRAGELRLIVQMQIGQRPPGLAEGPKISGLFHQRQVRQHLFQVRRKSLSVTWRMQQAVDVIENVFLRYPGAIAFPAMLQNEIGNAILACELRVIVSVKQRRVVDGFFFVIVKWKALCSSI